MSIFDNLFGKGATPPAATVAPGTPSGTGTTPGTAQNEPAPVPAVPAVPATSPLDQFKDLWQPPADGTAPKNSTGTFENVDPKKMLEAAAKINFAAGIPPEAIAIMNQGGEAGVKAMLEAMNKMSQQAYAQGAFASTQITNEALTRARSGLDTDLPGMLKRLNAGESLLKDNPIFSNPAVQPMMEAVQSQMATKFPKATSAELATMTKDFILAISGSVQDASKPATTESGKQPPQDFSSFFSNSF